MLWGNSEQLTSPVVPPQVPVAGRDGENSSRTHADHGINETLWSRRCTGIRPESAKRGCWHRYCPLYKAGGVFSVSCCFWMTRECNSAWISPQQPALVVAGMNRSEALGQKDECASASCKRLPVRNGYRAPARLTPPGYDCVKIPAFAYSHGNGVGVVLALAVSMELFHADSSSAWF